MKRQHIVFGAAALSLVLLSACGTDSAKTSAPDDSTKTTSADTPKADEPKIKAPIIDPAKIEEADKAFKDALILDAEEVMTRNGTYQQQVKVRDLLKKAMTANPMDPRAFWEMRSTNSYFATSGETSTDVGALESETKGAMKQGAKGSHVATREALLARALCRVQVEQFDEAVSDVEAALKLEASKETWLTTWADGLSSRLRDVESALKAGDRARALEAIRGAN